MFLTPADIVRLTGKKYAPAQKRVLKERRIRFTEDAFGRPVVLKATVERKLLGEVVSEVPVTRPDFSGFPRLV